jgi:hypothetical protein
MYWKWGVKEMPELKSFFRGMFAGTISIAFIFGAWLGFWYLPGAIGIFSGILSLGLAFVWPIMFMPPRERG